MVGCVTSEDGPCAVTIGYIIWLQMSLASKYSLPGVANCGAMHDHMIPCGVEIKHASTCMCMVAFGVHELGA